MKANQVRLRKRVAVGVGQGDHRTDELEEVFRNQSDSSYLQDYRKPRWNNRLVVYGNRAVS